jgi:Fe-S oxidoreductase
LLSRPVTGARNLQSLPYLAGVNFAILGPAETCTGDPARRIGNEFVYSMLAQQNIETLNEAGARTIVASCPHRFNTIANEYPQLKTLEVVDVAQVLMRSVAPSAETAGPAAQTKRPPA